MNAASRAQNDAAHPGFSTWLSANAGSGKTRVLTNRVALLLLNGAEPSNILCLTYTKAAASEMQNRLFGTLGSWAMLDDGRLREALRNVGYEPPDDLSKARTLFARAIEAPGGLKIQTIHSLCSTVLRQFPLEAGVSPQFRELDEPSQSQLIERVLAEMAETHAAEMAAMSRFYAGESLAALGQDIARHAEAFSARQTRETVFDAYGVPRGTTANDILEAAFCEGDLAFLKDLVPILDTSGSASNGRLARRLGALPDEPSFYALDILENALLTKENTKEPFSAKTGSLPAREEFRNGPFRTYSSKFVTIMERIAETRIARVAFEAASKTATLHDFATVFLPAYKSTKARHGVLDFDDLIRQTGALLDDYALSWVHFRIDSRIDHILVDEAQDTSPDQWRIVEALAAGISMDTRGGLPRTLFVVGDRKQSIYSFQGADAAGFDRMADSFRLRLDDSLRRRQLQHSFRSSPAILAAVDATMAALGVGGQGGDAHVAFHDAMPGRVDLWPLEPRPEIPEEPDWHDPVDRPVANAAPVVLANKLAEYVRGLLEKGTIPGNRSDFRAVEPGDILILVQRRSELFDQIIRACKAISLPIAGADRLKIGAELAVRDLLALFSFLSLPEDDLSLAAALRSPLFGWSERSLFDLAHARKAGASLWNELSRRTDEFTETVGSLRKFRDLSDFQRPYELLEGILTEFDGRRKLLARLGPEAEDGINELSNLALVFERDEVPSITGFVRFAQSADTEIKRQSDTSGNMIRVMTVHGAKGLESPIVILPDTVSARANSGEKILLDAEGVPLLPLSKARSPARIQAAKDAKDTADREERNRLLYVAMTRAEKWLIVAGIEPSRSGANIQNWHSSVEAGLRSAGATAFDSPTGIGLRLQFGNWLETAEHANAECRHSDPLPSFLTAPVPPARQDSQLPLSPSKLGGAKVLGGGELEESEALRRGRQIHHLLEHLPGHSDHEALANALLVRGPDSALPDEVPGLLAEARRVLEAHPELFDAEALVEVDITARLPTLGHEISGAIDRLVIRPDRILAVDFKTNAVVPARPEDTPEGLLRQMGAYLEALQQIWPEKPVEIAILWTARAELMTIPHGIVREALTHTTTS